MYLPEALIFSYKAKGFIFSAGFITDIPCGLTFRFGSLKLDRIYSGAPESFKGLQRIERIRRRFEHRKASGTDRRKADMGKSNQK